MTTNSNPTHIASSSALGTGKGFATHAPNPTHHAANLPAVPRCRTHQTLANTGGERKRS